MSTSLSLTRAHSLRLKRLAALLEVTPEDFLGWQLDDLLNQLEDPDHGLLEDWARGMIVWDDETARERVSARVDVWLFRRHVRMDRRAKAA